MTAETAVIGGAFNAASKISKFAKVSTMAEMNQQKLLPAPCKLKLLPKPKPITVVAEIGAKSALKSITIGERICKIKLTPQLYETVIADGLLQEVNGRTFNVLRKGTFDTAVKDFSKLNIKNLMQKVLPEGRIMYGSLGEYKVTVREFCTSNIKKGRSYKATIDICSESIEKEVIKVRYE